MVKTHVFTQSLSIKNEMLCFNISNWNLWNDALTRINDLTSFCAWNNVYIPLVKWKYYHVLFWRLLHIKGEGTRYSSSPKIRRSFNHTGIILENNIMHGILFLWHVRKKQMLRRCCIYFVHHLVIRLTKYFHFRCLCLQSR